MKTSAALIPLIATMAILFLSGCSSLYYAPNAQNVPLFKDKNEARISAAYCFSEDGTGPHAIKGLEVQSAFAPGKHLGIMVNGATASSNGNINSQDETMGSQKSGFIEFGAGYFKAFSQDRLVVEAYGGFGGGRFENSFTEGQNAPLINNSINYKRLFFQPSIGFSSQYVGAAFSLRLALLMYDQAPEPGLETSYILAEPCFTVRAGWQGFKFQTQILYSNNLTYFGFPQHHLNFNTGICLTIPAKKSIE